MFSIKETTAIIARIMITHFAFQFEAINKTLSGLAGDLDMEVLFQYGSFKICMTRQGSKGSLFFIDTEMDFNKEFKLNSRVKPINRRVTQDMEVWFHRELRELEEQGRAMIDEAVGAIDLVKALKEVPFMSRLLGRSVTTPISLGNDYINTLLQVEVRYTVNIFNKAKVFESVFSYAGVGILAKVIPTTYNEFSGTIGKDPINSYVQQVIREHAKTKLR